jgi:FKBP-type peptidyl-prolyl cis-trans isomerase
MKSFLKIGMIALSISFWVSEMVQAGYTASGIGVQDIKVGSGATANPGQKIAINYKCHVSTIAGPVYDKSPDGSPKEFNLGVGQFVGNWDDSIKGMRVGGKRIVTIPPDLNPGFKGPLMTVPRARPLIVEVELVSVK